MSYRTITFEAVKRTAKLSGTCAECGKKRTRSVTVEKTINPFNRNDDGTVKSREQVAADVERQMADIRSESFVCASCIKARRGW